MYEEYTKEELAEHPYQVFGVFYNSNDEIVDGDAFFGEFDTENEAIKCAKSINTFIKGKSFQADYMIVQVELVSSEDEDDCTEALEILYESNPIYHETDPISYLST